MTIRDKCVKTSEYEVRTVTARILPTRFTFPTIETGAVSKAGNRASPFVYRALYELSIPNITGWTALWHQRFPLLLVQYIVTGTATHHLFNHYLIEQFGTYMQKTYKH